MTPDKRTSDKRPPEKRTIAFVINSLGPGGAERVMTTVLEHARDAWNVHLILLDQETEHRTPPPFVTVHRLNCGGRLRPSIKQLRATLKQLQPDLIVSFLVRANIAATLAGRALRIPVVISERSQLSTHLSGRHGFLRGLAAKLAPRLIYPRADHIIAVSEGVRSDLIARFGVRPNRVTTIYNPYDVDAIASQAAQPPEIPLPPRFMVSVGRLVEAKGFEDLIDAYAKVWPELPLVILGDGPDRADLTARVTERGLFGRIIFAGYVRNPFAVVGRASLFVSASHCEGFPNAIAEAMALGVPVVATDCPSGPAELLHETETTGTRDVLSARHGILVPVREPATLGRAMQRMSDEVLRRDYAQRASARITAFSPDHIMNQYWSLFDRIGAARRRVTTAAERPAVSVQAGAA